MKLLITTIAYEPKTGGIETHTKLLAQYLRDLGHEVVIVTKTTSNLKEDSEWKIYRKPTPYQAWRCYAEADQIIQNNFSIKLGWPLLFYSDRTVIIHHTWLNDGSLRAKLLLPFKQFLCSFSAQFSNSKVIANRLWAKSIVIGNPYDDRIFYNRKEIEPQKNVVVVGRLVYDKGIDIAIKAFFKVLHHYPETKLTIIGEGNEENRLKNLVKEMGIGRSVNFLGVLKGNELAEVYASHQVCLIPSRWEEPFGIVALEALACGCRVVYSRVGGLSEALGEQGTSFANESIEECAVGIQDSMRQGKYSTHQWEEIKKHLEQFRCDVYFKNLFELMRDHRGIKL